MATSWASPQEHDAPWWVDVGAAVGDFVLGGIQDTAGMFGLYHDERGWGADSWGAWRSNLGEYWGQTLATPAYLLGLYNGENLVGSVGEWGTNLATTWGEVAHSVVPWREWDTRPGYVITTAALNLGGIALDIASVAGGTALSATGYGAVLGVPLAVWRGASLLNRLGKFGGLLPDAPSSTPDVNVSLGDRLSLPDGLNLPDGRTPGQVTTDLGDAADALSLPSTRLDALTDALTNADAFGHPPSGDSGHPPGNTPDTGDAPPTRPATAEDHRPPQQPDDSGQPSHPAQDTPAPGGTGSDRDGDTEADTSPTQTPATAPSDTGQAAELPTTEQILRLHEDIEHFLRQNAEVPVGAGVGGRTPGGPLPDLSPSAHSRDHTPTGEPTGSGGGPGDGPADPPGTRNGDSSPTSGHGDTSTSGGSSANSGGGNSFGRGGNGGPPTGGRLPESGPGEGLDGRTGGNGRSGGSSGEGESNSGLPGEDRNLGDRKDGDNGEEPIRGERDPDNSRSTEETGSDSSAAGESGTGGSDPGGRPVSNPTGGMLPELESSVREELRKAGVDRDIWENVVSRLEKSPYGQRVAELVTSGKLSDVPGYRTVLSMCADKQDLDNRLAAPRMALEHAAELQDAGVTNIAFEHRFTDPDTGQAQDIDVVAFGPDGEPSHGYELKDVLSINGIDKRAKEANQQFDNIDQEALTERIIIIDCHQSVGNFPEAKQRKIERFAERSGTTFRIRFEDGFVTIPDKNIFP